MKDLVLVRRTLRRLLQLNWQVEPIRVFINDLVAVLVNLFAFLFYLEIK
jgi:hypothetical protein